MRPIHLVVSAFTPTLDGICLSQTAAGAGNLTLNGSAVMANDGSASSHIGHAVLTPPRRVAFTSLGDLSGVTFTITGYNRVGRLITDALVGPVATTIYSSKVFAEVLSISTSGLFATALTVGWGAEGLSVPVAVDRFRNPCNVGLVCNVTLAVPTYTVEHTGDDIYADGFNEGTANWLPHASIVNANSSTDGNYAFGVSAIRLRVSAGPGTVLFNVIQAGL